MQRSNKHLMDRQRRNSGRRAAAVAAAAVTSVALAAGGAYASNSGARAAGRAVAKAAAGQTLTIQFTPPVSLNPALGGTSQSYIDFGALDYDSLIYQESNGSYVGDLATKWGYAPKSKNEIFDMTLRSGVHFSDGSLMTPQSVVNSIKYFKSANGPQAAYLATLTSITATGANTVQMKFAAPAPDLPFLLDQYQDVGQIIGPQGIASPASLATSSDGAGPYELNANQTVTNSSYVFDENPHYWNPKAVHYSTVIVKVITDPQTAVSSAASGQVQALTFLPPQVLAPAKTAGLTAYAEPFSIASLILMGRSEAGSPLKKMQVREAINDAVDRAALAKGLGGSAAVPTDEVSLPGTTGYDPGLGKLYSYNPKTAKKLLASAGYPHGFTLQVLDTLALDPNGDIGAELKSELGAIGITVQITETPSPAQFVPAALSKKYSAVIWPISQDGYGFPYSVEFGLAPFTNVFGSTSAALNALLGTAATATTSAAQTAAYEKVNDFLVGNAWYCPLYGLDSVVAFSSSVKNVQAPTLDNTTVDPVSPIASQSWYPAS